VGLKDFFAWLKKNNKDPNVLSNEYGTVRAVEAESVEVEPIEAIPIETGKGAKNIYIGCDIKTINITGENINIDSALIRMFFEGKPNPDEDPFPY